MGTEIVALRAGTAQPAMMDAAKAKYGTARYEALTSAAISSPAEEAAVQADIPRSPDDAPELGECGVVAEKLPIALGRQLHAGLFGDLS
jgi:hypothetical protein